MTELSIVSRLLPGYGKTTGPAGAGPFPAVLLLHGSEGGFSSWSHRYAALLAAHGYLAFPFPYSQGGNAWNAGAIKDIELGRTAEAIAALRNFAACDGRVALFGASRGGEHALLVTSLMARDGIDRRPDAVAAHAAADVICGAFDARRWRDRGDPGWQTWDPADRAWLWNGKSDELLPSTPIEIERYDGPLLLTHGTEDGVWSVEMTRRLERRLKAAGRSPDVHYFEGEDHSLRSDAENRFNSLLLDFLDRTMPAKDAA